MGGVYRDAGSMGGVVRMTDAGEYRNGAVRVTIPKSVRDGLDIVAGTVLRVLRKKNQIIFEVE